MAIVALGDDPPALGATGPAVTGEVDAAPIEFPLVTAAQRAGDRDELGSPWDRGAPIDVPLRDSPPVETVVLARGSQRLMDPSKRLPQSVLRACVEAALRGISIPHWVVVHNVDGLTPASRSLLHEK